MEGRSAIGEWFYVRDDQGVEGFAYAPRFEWTGDYESLPVKQTTVTPAPTSTSPSTGTPYPLLTMDLWDIVGTEYCSRGVWYKSVYIQGHGGDGVYTYYWNGEQLTDPTGEGFTFEVHGAGGPIIGTGKIVSGDGQEVSRDLFIAEPDCGN